MKDESGNAFPGKDAKDFVSEGLTKREYIAITADQNFIEGLILDSDKDNTLRTYMRLIIKKRYEYADAMLEAGKE